MSASNGASRSRDLGLTALVALSLRLAVAGLASNRFPPADDGVLYDALAKRLAHGDGYTWAWPDGAVTPVAHYPVGYPSLVAAAYRIFGEHPLSALLVHALLGALGAVSVHRVAQEGASRRAARWAGLAVAAHPALLFYTPAIMTEGVCSALVAAPFAVALLARRASGSGGKYGAALLAGALIGLAALVRPQVLLLAPFVAILAAPSDALRRRALPSVLAIVATVLVLAPWTLRNQRVFGRPVLVSANSGWNLLIGTDPEANGSWRPLESPTECREVWGEADKDACFGRAARRRIADDPAAWLRLVPSKLAATFDLGGSGPSNLSRARPDLVPRWMVLVLGGIETVFERLALLAALLGLAFGGDDEGPKRRGAIGVGVVSSAFVLMPHVWPAYVGLFVLLVARADAPPLRRVTAWVLGTTLVTHAVFFGAGRYALLVVPWVAALAAVEIQRSSTRGHWLSARDGSTVTRSGASKAAISAKCS